MQGISFANYITFLIQRARKHTT